MEKLLKDHKDVGTLVVHASKRNPFEAWRQVHQKLDPLNDQAAGQAVRAILDPKKWAVTSITQIPAMLARWEGIQREHQQRTGEKVLTASAGRALLLEMIPTKLTEHIRTQKLLMKRSDLTYERLRLQY